MSNIFNTANAEVTAARLLTKTLERHGVSVIFGYPGAAICPFFDTLTDSSIHLVTVRQEQMAGHSASGYARISGDVGVCAVTSGPGALNLLPAIATAYMDSIPLVIITGQVSSELLGRDVFQEADITGAAEPFVKHSYLVRDAAAVPRIAAEAFYIASTGRKGPVLIDIPEDVLRTVLPYNLIDTAVCTEMRGYFPYPPIDVSAVDRAAELIKRARRPLICIGGGVLGGNAEDVAREFVTEMNIPFVSTMMGLSALSPTLPQSVGRIGMYGDKKANQALMDCDLLLLCGARVGDRAIMSPIGMPQAGTPQKGRAKATIIIHMDIDPAELNKNMKTDVPIIGDVKESLPLILARIKGVSFTDWIKEASPIKPTRDCQLGGASPELIMDTLCHHADADAIFTVDVGQNLIWAARGYMLERGRFLASGGMGTMGYSLPAAIGAAIADDKRQVIAICGDGGFQMSFCELATMVQEGLKIKLLIFQNHGLGMVRELQEKSYHGNTIAVNLQGDPDFAILASAYGIKIWKIEDDTSLDKTVAEWLASDSSAVLICEIDKRKTSL